MSSLLSFEFVAVLNLLVLLLWPTSLRYSGSTTEPNRYSAVGIIVLILTVLAIILDIIFLAKQLHF